MNKMGIRQAAEAAPHHFHHQQDKEYGNIPLQAAERELACLLRQVSPQKKVQRAKADAIVRVNKDALKHLANLIDHAALREEIIKDEIILYANQCNQVSEQK